MSGNARRIGGDFGKGEQVVQARLRERPPRPQPAALRSAIMRFTLSMAALLSAASARAPRFREP